MSWPLVKIGEHVERVETWNPISSGIDDLFKYIDLSSVDKDSKSITESAVDLIHPNSAPSRARQIVKENDVLISTVRPNLNGVALVNQELDGATASTGYCVLRANKKSLDSKYLFYWVQSSDFIDDMIKNATGANYPAVSDRIVKNNLIPFPPLEEQKRIAAILDKADSIRCKRKQAIKLADDFLRSVFLEMFGDPVTNPKGWEVRPLGELCSFQGGFAFKSSDYTGHGVPLLKITNVHFEDVDWDDVSYLPEKMLLEKSDFSLKEGDLVMAMTRPIIKSLEAVKVVEIKKNDIPSLLNQRVGRFAGYERLAAKEFLKYFLYSGYFKSEVEKLCSVALQPNVSSKQIESILCYLPARDIQDEFSKIVSCVYKMLPKLKAASQERLFESLSQKAFSGTL